MGTAFWMTLAAAAVWPVVAWWRKRRVPGYTEWCDSEAGEGCAIEVGAEGRHVVRFRPEGEEGILMFSGHLGTGVHRFARPAGRGAGEWRIEAPRNTVVRRVAAAGPSHPLGHVDAEE